MSGPAIGAAELGAELSDLATLAIRRRSGPDRPWSSAAETEHELLSRAAALAEKLGAGVVERVREVAPFHELDSGGAFASALVLGSVVTEGADGAAEAAARTLVSIAAAGRAACADALALAPSPAIGPRVADLLRSPDPGILRAALGVLRARKQVPYGRVVPFLAHPTASVATAAVRCLGVVQERDAAALVLDHIAARVPEHDVGLAAAEALLELGHAGGLLLVRRCLIAEVAKPTLSDEARVAYLRLLAIAGDAQDRDLFFRSVETAPGDAAAVGWFGHPDLVDWLLGSLEAANETRRAKPSGPSAFEIAAARALERMLGQPGRQGDSMEPGAQGRALLLEASRWRAHWQAIRPGAGSYKLRFGQPYDPLATVEELEAPTSPSGRADAALELAAASRGASVVEPNDWISRQRAVLRAARTSLSREAWPTGAFVGERLSSRAARA